jgi:histidine triad (HIT) family protein
MSDCLFCKIIAGQIPSEIAYQDEHCVAFRDINPAAPMHYLIVPRTHVATVNDATAENAELFGRLYVAAANLARQLGVDARGYRLVTNCNKDAGQVIFHVHVHFLAGQPMGWQPA